jgi:hypothetical protein
VKHGPPAGTSSSDVFTDWVCYPPKTVGSTKLPESLSTAIATRQETQAKFTGRDAQRAKLHPQHSSAAPTARNIKSEDDMRIKLFKAYKEERDAQLDRVQSLIDFPGLDAVSVNRYKKEKLALMMQPVVTMKTCMAASSDEIPMADSTNSIDFNTPSPVGGMNANRSEMLTFDMAPMQLRGAFTANFVASNTKQGDIATAPFLTMIPPPTPTHPLLYQLKQFPADTFDSDQTELYKIELRKLAGFFPAACATLNLDVQDREEVLSYQPAYLVELATRYEFHHVERGPNSLYQCFSDILNDRNRFMAATNSSWISRNYDVQITRHQIADYLLNECPKLLEPLIECGMSSQDIIAGIRNHAYGSELELQGFASTYGIEVCT